LTPPGLLKKILGAVRKKKGNAVFEHPVLSVPFAIELGVDDSFRKTALFHGNDT